MGGPAIIKNKTSYNEERRHPLFWPLVFAFIPARSAGIFLFTEKSL